MTDIHWTEAEELAAKICGLGDDYESDQVEQALFDKYEISFEKFNELIEDLVPLCEVGVSPLTDQKYRGFANDELFCMMHYPLAEFNKCHHGSFHIHRTYTRQL